LEDAYNVGWGLLYEASRLIDPDDPRFRSECADLLKGGFGRAQDLLKYFQDLAKGIGGGIKFTNIQIGS
jgi:hypothetical protein